MLESCYPVQDEAGRVSRVIHFFHDLTALRRAKNLTRLAFYDGVTGLPNRSLFHERLIAAIEAAARSRKGLAVLYSDVEHFNCINMVLDHDAGDELLRLIASRMRHILRASDAIARVGGDEFAVILPQVATVDAALHTSDKLRRACGGWYEAAGKQYSVNVSVGLGLYPRDGESAETLLRSAETAMYRVKAGNREAYAVQARYTGTPYDVTRPP
jgi:diguanylate cyclase (GGDEF)-like protein